MGAGQFRRPRGVAEKLVLLNRDFGSILSVFPRKNSKNTGAIVAENICFLHSNEFLSPNVFALDGCFSREKRHYHDQGDFSCVDGPSVSEPSSCCLVQSRTVKISHRKCFFISAITIGGQKNYLPNFYSR